MIEGQSSGFGTMYTVYGAEAKERVKERVGMPVPVNDALAPIFIYLSPYLFYLCRN